MANRQLLKITMDKENSNKIIFDISKQIKFFYETPVILFTKEDFADNVFNAMCSMRTALQGESKTEVMDILVDFHLQWLHAVKNVDQFFKRLNDLHREEVYQSVSSTIDALSNRLKYYQRYITKHRTELSNQDQANLLADNEIIEEMHKEAIQILLEKLKCFRSFDGDDVFKIKVRDAVDELLNWIDKISDGFSLQVAKYINVNVPHLSGDLTKTLQQIVDEFQSSMSPAAKELLEDLKAKGKQLSSMIRCTAVHNLEISTVVEKINILEDRISRMENEPTSAALMALKNKKEYLESHLATLESLKTTLTKLQENTNVNFDLEEGSLCSCEDFFQLRIFNHSLPPEERERLVTELCYLWDIAVFGEQSHKSIISILSAADMKEEFSDELGTFYIDEHSRKIYKLPDDNIRYQQNEQCKLVPLSDDAEHVYFYDECGRYFVDPKSRQRVYKAHATASEYMMDSSGILLKHKEERDGVTYHYDNYGRYYIDSDGKHIYREADAVSEYENDGLGNLVRIRSHLDIFEPCPDDVHVTEDYKYLKLTVGKALRECIADVVVHQPADPIKYLSDRLIKYRENMEMREKLAREKEDLDAEREIRIAEEREAAERAAKEAALLAQGGSEASYDSNLYKYASMHLDDDDVLSVPGSPSVQ